jgi:hypothetical protein
MSTNTDTINAAVRLESKAANEVEASVVEGNRGDVPFTIELLLNATQHERESLDAIEESISTLRISLEQRRKVIDQQDEILRDLSDSLSTTRRRLNAKRRQIEILG